MRRPNFFLVGAPKCGTTSLASWLRGHPSVFITDPKEPMFFNTDFGWRGFVRLDDYEELFRGATATHVAVGEASTFYLCSRAAVPAILDYVPDAKLIVMLRRPTDMVVSLHAQACRGFETEDFERAWRLQAARARGEHLPRFAQHPELYQYGERCRVGTQLERLLRLLPRERVLVLFLEDFITGPAAELDRVQAFLGLPPIGEASLPPENARTRVRSVAFKTLLNGLGHAKGSLGISMSTGLLAPLYRRNIAAAPYTAPLSPALARSLEQYFSDEVALVEKWVGRLPPLWTAAGPGGSAGA